MKGIILGILALLIVPMFVSAVVGVPFTGTVGSVTDAGASFGGSYMRMVGDPAPAGFAHTYQWGTPLVTCDPNNEAVTFTGTINVNSMNTGDVAFIGLVDKGLLGAGKSGFMSGAYAYIYRNSATTVRIGPSDGNLGGEIVQVFSDYTIPSDGILNIVLTIYNNQVSVSVNGETAIVDDYGTVKVLNNLVANGYYDGLEFGTGAIPGWTDSPQTNMPYDMVLTGCQVEAGNEVPEFGLIAGVVALVGLVAGVTVLRKRN